MSFRNEDALRLSFKLVCMIGVLSMVGYWVYKFLVEDRDIGVVDYEPLGTSEIDLPVASICIVNPFLGRKISFVEPQHNETTYLAYIKGDIDAPEFQGTHYENLTLDLNDYLTTVAMEYRNGSRQLVSKPNKKHQVIFNGIYYRGKFVKCFAYQLDEHERQNISSVHYKYNKTRIFHDLGDPEQQDRAIVLSIYYPYQFLMQIGNYYAINTSKFTVVTINDMEFLKARKKHTRDCMVDWMSYDEAVLRKHLDGKVCVAPYQDPYSSLPICRNKTEIKKSTYNYITAREIYHPPACHRISKISVLVQGRPYAEQILKAHRHAWNLLIRYPKNWIKVIQQSKEVDAHSLIGNIGGYVGLFLGNNIMISSNYHLVMVSFKIFRLNLMIID